ncbi:MarR family transcriptional regulator [Sulfitobacter sp. F26204]|uniref:GbsR/MarR family transcriptional regulator n=1 Tax=Sulfitobacter sp. F26204 TaxID=2996014 RepID=UPI00225E66C1|nr:MarR family transcriptional regulator [Sulfitobacter sp. F26204]MCX7558394.1 MarR family transcriptional regulator [Sulfitobacter sp. F26204]
MSAEQSLDVIRSEFIEKTGLISQAEGLPRIAGRVFGMLIFDGDMVSFSDLATGLQVSRASISTSIRILEERGLVKRMTKPGERQDYFQLAPNPYATMLTGIQKRTLATRSEIADTISKLPANASAADRLAAYADFYASLDSAIKLALDELDAPTTSKSGQHPAASKDLSDDR